MPIYEFECENCQHLFELTMKITDPLPGSCPKCHTRKLRKLISRTSFALKGSGWFNTLYHKPKDPSKNESFSASESPKTESGSSPSTTATGAGDCGKPVCPCKPAAPG
jgi:putative FmdB family regulatory protein